MSAADGLVRNEEVAGATPAIPTIFWKAGRYKLAAPVSKTGSGQTEVGALPTPSANHQPDGGRMDSIVLAIIHVVIHALFALLHDNSAQRRLERSAWRVRNPDAPKRSRILGSAER